MFANTFQSGFISIFYSVGSSPLSLWDKQVKNGHIRRIIDDEVKSLVLEVSGTNVATTYITCPIKPRASLAIRLPFLVMIVKNLKKYFTFEIQILDDKDMRRRFRVSNFQSTTKVRPFCTTMPIGLSSGWNQIQFNLADFTRRAYGTMYLETMRVQVHANVRIRRIYFADRLYNEEEMPSEYRLFVPLSSQKDLKGQDQKKSKDELQAEAKKESKQVVVEIEQPVEPSAAPPSPVGTEAQEEQVKEIQLDTETGEIAEAGDAIPSTEVEGEGEGEDKTEATEIPQSEEAPTEEPQSEAPPSEEQPSDVAPSDEPPSTEAPSEEPVVDVPPPEEPQNEAPQTEPATEAEE